ncbi:MAG: hypothetical protein IJQ31_16925 [Thermoguttaceae bacterium]|nr:hypothetical protein [Thermoguttaceae bacterium]
MKSLVLGDFNEFFPKRVIESGKNGENLPFVMFLMIKTFEMTETIKRRIFSSNKLVKP